MVVERGALYESVVGAEWQLAPVAVRRAHLHTENLLASGIFCVKHGRGLLVRLLIWLLRLPRAGPEVPVHLHVTRHPAGEGWVRQFGERRIVTVQRAVAGGLLGERFGPLEFQFRLQIDGGAVDYIQQRAVINVGKLCLPLPRGIAPQVSATESAVGTDRTFVHVTVSLPGLGLLIEYAGELSVEGESA